MTLVREAIGSLGYLLQEDGSKLLQENDCGIVLDGVVVSLLTTAHKGRSGFTAKTSVANRSIDGTGYLLQESSFFLTQEDDFMLVLEGESYPLILTATRGKSAFTTG